MGTKKAQRDSKKKQCTLTTLKIHASTYNIHFIYCNRMKYDVIYSLILSHDIYIYQDEKIVLFQDHTSVYNVKQNNVLEKHIFRVRTHTSNVGWFNSYWFEQVLAITIMALDEIHHKKSTVATVTRMKFCQFVDHVPNSEKEWNLGGMFTEQCNGFFEL